MIRGREGTARDGLGTAVGLKRSGEEAMLQVETLERKHCTMHAVRDEPVRRWLRIWGSRPVMSLALTSVTCRANVSILEPCTRPSLD